MEWQAQLYPNGYGLFNVKKPQRALAHRIAFSLVHGPIPFGMVVMHTCDNPRCVNVDHLKLGTQAENVADMVNKGRQKRSKRRAPRVAMLLEMMAHT